jgi:DNA-binding NarL/FixJ family response regulator
MTESLRVIIADDHSVVRRGVKEILSEEFPNLFLEEAESGAQLFSKLGDAGKHWDLLILDLGLPGESGVDILLECRKKYAHLPVLVLSMYPEEKFAIRVLKMGAMGFVSKQSAPSDIGKAVSTVLSGKRHLSLELAESLGEIDGELDGADANAPLSQRELQVIVGIANGRAMKEIAGELEVSMKSASTYRMRAMRKLNLKNNADIILYALDEGLIVPKVSGA